MKLSGKYSSPLILVVGFQLPVDLTSHVIVLQVKSLFFFAKESSNTKTQRDHKGHKKRL
jgi:hypothetical protein